MSRDDQDGIQSFFGVGGIHGLGRCHWQYHIRPRRWSVKWGGYCTHGSILFPTRHWPYVMLYEACPLSSSSSFVKYTFSNGIFQPEFWLMRRAILLQARTTCCQELPLGQHSTTHTRGDGGSSSNSLEAIHDSDGIQVDVADGAICQTLPSQVSILIMLSKFYSESILTIFIISVRSYLFLASL